MSIIAAIARLHTRPRDERRLLRRTAALFVCARLVLRVRNLESARRTLGGIAQRLHIRSRNVEELGNAISSVNRNLPGQHSCLIDALCCEAIAQSSGIPVELKLGAAPGTPQMRFHAWVEHQGHIIAGHHEGEFTPFH